LFFEKNIKSAEILPKIEENFDQKTKDLKFNKQDIILASIIERETNKTEERSQIAALYLNRLQQDMKLEADPTVRYGMDKDFVEKNEKIKNRIIK